MTITLTGVSGTDYEFTIYTSADNFKAVGGVYCMSKRTVNKEGKGEHATIYIGQTGDLSTRFDDHHKQKCFDKHGANRISIHLVSDKKKREAIEEDLIKAYQPPCNEQHKD